MKNTKTKTIDPKDKTNMIEISQENMEIIVAAEVEEVEEAEVEATLVTEVNKETTMEEVQDSLRRNSKITQIPTIKSSTQRTINFTSM